MTVANKITIFRIVLVPAFLVALFFFVSTGDEWRRWLALSIFATAAVSDGIDGYIARHYRQGSNLGAWLDPAADKLLLVSAIIFLSLDHQPHLDRVPLWLTATIITRDLVVVAGLGVLYFLTRRRPVIRPRLSGKASTVFQVATVLWILVGLSAMALAFVAFVAAFLTGMSGILYIVDGIRQLRAAPARGRSGQ